MACTQYKAGPTELPGSHHRRLRISSQPDGDQRNEQAMMCLPDLLQLLNERTFSCVL